MTRPSLGHTSPHGGKGSAPVVGTHETGCACWVWNWGAPLPCLQLTKLLLAWDALGAAAMGPSAEVKEVLALLQVQRPQVVLKGAPCEVQLHADDEGWPGGSEVQDGDSGLGSFLRVLVAIEAFPDLVLIHVTEGHHLALAGGGQAAVQPAPLLAGVPDGEGCPAGKGLLFQEADAVGPDGRLKDGVRGRPRVVSVQQEALVHADDAAALPEVLVEEQQVLWDALTSLVKGAHVGKPRPRTEPGGHDHRWTICGENLRQELLGRQLVDPTCVSFGGVRGISPHSATDDARWVLNGSLVLQPHPLGHHDVIRIQKAKVRP